MLFCNFLITNIRHPLKRFDIHSRPVHKLVKKLKRPVFRFFHAARAGVPEGAHLMEFSAGSTAEEGKLGRILLD